MDETVIVIMMKNLETGFLETEIGSYNVGDNDSLIHNIYALKVDGDIVVHMRLSVDRELLDWEYSAVLDYYDTEALSGLVSAISEDDTSYDPVWEVSFDFYEDFQMMEEKLSAILNAHRNELNSVYEAIEGLEADYN